MTNHARTLLLNISASDVDTTVPGVEYVDPGFTALTLPRWAQTFREILFGKSLDQFYLNYQLYSCLQILNSTEYAGFVTDLDSRVTYNLRQSPFLNFSFSMSYAANNAKPLELVGNDVALDSSGIAYKEWELLHTGSSFIVVNITTESTLTQTITMTGGRTNAITLPGSPVVGYITGTPTGGDRWSIRSYTKPAGDWLTKYNKLKSSLVVLEGLFDNVLFEPYKSFWNMFSCKLGINYNLSGLLLAYIYKLEELRNADSSIQ